MKEKSLILLDWQADAAAKGRITQVRLPMEPQPEDRGDYWHWGHAPHKKYGEAVGWTKGDDVSDVLELFSPYRVGTVLVGKETWASPEKNIVAYKATAECGAWMGDGGGGRIWVHHGYILESPAYRRCFREPGRTFGLGRYGGRWRSPAIMPKWAARFRWRVEALSVRRVGEITAEEVYQHGIDIEQEPHSTIFDRAEHAAIGGLCIECDAEVWPFRHIWERRYGNRYPWPDAWAWVVKLKPEKV